MDKPTLYVPQPRSNWRLTLLRLWIVLGAIVTWLVFTAGERELHFRNAVFAFGAWCAVAYVIGWIFRPALPPQADSD